MLPLLSFVVVAAIQAPSATAPRDARDPVRATCAVSGRVSEAGSGHPIPRATVRLAGSSQRFETIADVEGRYEFTALEPGEYALWATAGELIATHLAQAFGTKTPMPPFSQPSSNIALKPGDSLTEMNMALTRSLAIEGRVLDPWNEPMANVAVDVIRADGAPYPTQGNYSDDRGEYRAFGLAPGRYRVCARVETYSRSTSDDRLRFVRTCHLASISESNGADVIVDAEDASGIDIRVQRSATYSVSGLVLDAAGVPADGAAVVASRDDHSVGADASVRSGQFVLSGLTSGRYAVTASLGGPADPLDTRPPARERELGYAMVEIEEADASGVVLSLSKAVKIPGRVRFERRGPSPNQLRMSVYAGPSQGPFDRFGERPGVAAVDDDLNFELASVYRLPLVVGIQGLPEGWVLKSVRYDGKDITNLATDLGGAARERRLDILVTNRVARPSVRVTDDMGNPVADYQVVLLAADPARSNGWLPEPSDAPSRDGVSKLGTRLPGDYLIAAVTADDYRILVSHRERIELLRSVAQRVTLTEGDERVLQLHLTRLPGTPK
jgi:protocatechuate 3,4-dioxygenase beta subunit